MTHPKIGQPATESFKIVRRGYSKEHVDAYVNDMRTDAARCKQAVDNLTLETGELKQAADELQCELERATKERDNLSEKLTNSTVSLGIANSRVEQLIDELNRISEIPISNTGLSERMDRMLSLAAEEADQLRSNACTESERILELASVHAAKLTAEAETLQSTMEAKQAQTETEYVEVLRDARVEASRIIADAGAQRAELEQSTVEEIAKQRTAAEASTNSLLENSRSEAERLLRNARSDANQIVLQAKQEADSVLNESEIQQQMADHAKGVIVRQLADIRDRLDDIPDILFHSHQYTSSEVVRSEFQHSGS